jgi:glutamine synthetase
MLGSSSSIACSNIMLNTIVSEELSQFADILEKAKDFKKKLQNLIASTIKKHKRIIFNGNNYSKEWEEEAKKRGLINLQTTADAVPHLISKKNIKLFEKHKIYTECELKSRHDIILENYCKIIYIEARTMVSMAKKNIIPAAITYSSEIAKEIMNKKSIPINSSAEELILSELSFLLTDTYEKLNNLENILSCTEDIENLENEALYCKDKIIPAMNDLRQVADKVEENTAKKYWPYETYSKLLFSVK